MSNVKQPIYPASKNTATGAYSPGLKVGNFVFVSGQGPLNPETKMFENLDIKHQTRLTLLNVQRVLEEAGSGLQDVVKVTVHLQNINDFDDFNDTYCTFFSECYPTRTTVQSVLAEGISIEIDAIAIHGCGQIK